MKLTEKYRPEKLEDVVGQEEAVNFLRYNAENGTTTDFLFHGPPGVGKTSTAYAFANEIDAHVWEENASNYGVDDVRGRIKKLSKTSVVSPEYSGRIIFLDEAEQLSHRGQQALRRIIEKSSKDNRFILAVNDREKLDVAVRSRLIRIPFPPVEEECIFEHLKNICELEGIPTNDEKLQRIAEGVEGRVRDAVQDLEVYRWKLQKV